VHKQLQIEFSNAIVTIMMSIGHIQNLELYLAKVSSMPLHLVEKYRVENSDILGSPICYYCYDMLLRIVRGIA
jgi:hypothetical protein